jgi:hypothetical protein
VLKCKRVFRVSKFSQRARRWTYFLVVARNHPSRRHLIAEPYLQAAWLQVRINGELSVPDVSLVTISLLSNGKIPRGN